MGDNKLRPGVYDLLVTNEVRKYLREFTDERVKEKKVTKAEVSQYLSELVQQVAQRAFSDMSSAASLEAVNDVIELLKRRAQSEAVTGQDKVDSPPSVLRSIAEESPYGDVTHMESPNIPLNQSLLVTNAHHSSHNLASHIRSEIRSADEVLLICSFIKWSGLRALLPSMNQLVQKRGKRMRVITTNYMNVTEKRALDQLQKLGVDIRVSYDGSVERLHAKAWLFRRDNQCTSAYIGSSNISYAALSKGLEWNVRLTRQTNSSIVDTFVDSFEGHWESYTFQPYNADEFAEAKRDYDESAREPRLPLHIDIHPYEHQREILDALKAERKHGHTKNLVVAATGTGKTIVAALDYRRLATPEKGRYPSLLFVAHRKEILEQARDAFRIVLKDKSFGELLVDGERPRGGRCVFASIQSLRNRINKMSKDDYEVVIVDEVHHASAPTYETLLKKLEPDILLGLTATPERADGQSILPWFDNRVAYELRLWKAIDEELLVPFHYFGVGTDVDLEDITWSSGGYKRSELSRQLRSTPNSIKQVARGIDDIVENPADMTCLAFCVDVAHARFVAEQLRDIGFSAHSLTGQTSSKKRSRLRRRLESGDIQILTVVNVFNEGVDIPQVDTVIFLRPTESATVYLQQLGRGLRTCRNKTHVTVLDFVGRANTKFRWDRRLQSLLGGSRKQVEQQVENDFPFLPSGCVISLDEKSKDAILSNIKHWVQKTSTKELVHDLEKRAAARGRAPTMGEFLTHAELTLEDIYPTTNTSSWRSWNALLSSAQLSEVTDEDVHDIERWLARVIHLDDQPRMEALSRFFGAEEPPRGDYRDPVQRNAFALFVGDTVSIEKLHTTWQRIWAEKPLLVEIRQLLSFLDDRLRKTTHRMDILPQTVPLRAHATYTMPEIMASFDQRSSKGTIKRIREGVKYLQGYHCDLFFVTLDKSANSFTETTSYKDYPITHSSFHWESQSTCHEDTITGRRYTQIKKGAANHAILFVRQRKKDSRGETAPYLCLGPVYYRGHRGGRPMQITWELEFDMPGEFYQEARIHRA